MLSKGLDACKGPMALADVTGATKQLRLVHGGLSMAKAAVFWRSRAGVALGRCLDVAGRVRVPDGLRQQRGAHANATRRMKVLAKTSDGYADQRTGLTLFRKVVSFSKEGRWCGSSH